MRLNGDSPYITGVLYSIPLENRIIAQEFANRLTSSVQVKPWKIIMTNKHNNNLWGKAFSTTRTILLHKKGENIGTLVHEMAHEDCREKHGNRFKIRQEAYTVLAIDIIKQMKGAQL